MTNHDEACENRTGGKYEGLSIPCHCEARKQGRTESYRDDVRWIKDEAEDTIGGKRPTTRQVRAAATEAFILDHDALPTPSEVTGMITDDPEAVLAFLL